MGRDTRANLPEKARPAIISFDFHDSIGELTAIIYLEKAHRLFLLVDDKDVLAVSSRRDELERLLECLE